LGAPKSFHGQVIEGSFHAHQVPLPGAKQDAEQLALLSSWLSSYKPSELFNEDGCPITKILDVIPKAEEKRLGRRKEANLDCFVLDLPEWQESAVEKYSQQSCMKIVGNFLGEVIERYVYS